MSGNTALPLLWPQLHVSSVPPFKGTLIDTLHIPEKNSILDDAPLYFVLCSCSHLAFVLLLSLFLGPVAATKLRSWLDTSSTFMEGSLPSARFGHGFATTEDGQVYAFGGQGQSGKQLPALYKYALYVLHLHYPTETTFAAVCRLPMMPSVPGLAGRW